MDRSDRHYRQGLFDTIRSLRDQKSELIHLVKGERAEIAALYADLKLARGPRKTEIYNEIQVKRQKADRLSGSIESITDDIEHLQQEINNYR